MTKYDRGATFQEEEPAARFKRHRAELSRSGVRGIEGRLVRGLDPMAMLVISEVAEQAQRVEQALGADPEQTRELTKELHFGGIWKHADELAAADSPEVRAWMVLAELTREVNDVELSDEEYLADVDRIVEALRAAGENSEAAKLLADASVETRMQRAQDDFIVEDGVAIGDTDKAFMSMAIRGEHAGVVRAGELLFVGSDTLDFDRVAQEFGLKREERFDERRQTDTVYYTGEVNGNEVEVKVLGNGFCIVFGEDMDIAKALARTGQ